MEVEVTESNQTLEYDLEHIFGTGIERLVQTQASDVDGGTNVWTVYLTNGAQFNFTVRNGKGATITDGDLYRTMEEMSTEFANFKTDVNKTVSDISDTVTSNKEASDKAFEATNGKVADNEKSISDNAKAISENAKSIENLQSTKQDTISAITGDWITENIV